MSKRVYKIEIPVDPVSKNQINAWRCNPYSKTKGKHTKYLYYQYRDRFAAYIWASVHSKSLERPDKKRRVVYTRVMPPKGRSFDGDGFELGLACIQDELTKNKLIHDDSDKWIDREYHQVRSYDVLKLSWHGLIIEIFE